MKRRKEGEANSISVFSAKKKKKHTKFLVKYFLSVYSYTFISFIKSNRNGMYNKFPQQREVYFFFKNNTVPRGIFYLFAKYFSTFSPQALQLLKIHIIHAI